MSRSTPSPLLLSRGTVRSPDGRPSVVLDGELCAGCNGRCGLRLTAKPTLPVAVGAEVADGTPVEVVVAANSLARRVLALFAPPLAVAVAAAVGSEYLPWDWRHWLVPAALATSIALTTSVLRFCRREPRREPAVETTGDGLRMQL